jgi:hypothetical protein
MSEMDQGLVAGEVSDLLQKLVDAAALAALARQAPQLHADLQQSVQDPDSRNGVCGGRCFVLELRLVFVAECAGLGCVRADNGDGSTVIDDWDRQERSEVHIRPRSTEGRVYGNYLEQLCDRPVSATRPATLS